MTLKGGTRDKKIILADLRSYRLTNSDRIRHDNLRSEEHVIGGGGVSHSPPRPKETEPQHP